MGALRPGHGEPRAASLDAAATSSTWQYEVRSNTHSTRARAARAIARRAASRNAVHAGPAEADTAAGRRRRPQRLPLYVLPNARVVHHFVPDMPLRVSALRGLGAYHNIFAIETFMDELAAAAGADPIEFRLRHLEDKRARDVITTAAERFGWSSCAARRRATAAASPSRATRISPPIAPSRSRSTSSTRAACASRPRRRRGRQRPGGQSRRHRQPDPGRHRAIGELDPLRIGALRPEAHLQPGLEHLSDPALRHVPESVDVHVIDRAGRAVPRHRRGGAGPDGRGDRQCRGERDRRAHSRPAAQFGAGEGGDRGLSLA